MRRALGALGGAFGALPLLPLARSLAERLAGPATLPGAERLAGDIKAATWAELLVLILVLPAVALLFGRVVPALIHRLGGFCVALPGVAMGSAFVLWRLGVRPQIALPAGLAAAGTVTALTILGPRLLGRRAVQTREEAQPSPPEEDGLRVGWPPVALALVVLFAAAVRIVDVTKGPPELFEEGQILAPVQVYLAGGAPYVDTYPVHGWGTDGGVDAVTARLFGSTLEVVRLRRSLTAALGVPALALACWALFRRPLWSLAAFGFALGLCPYPSERQMPAFAGLAALVWAARSGRRRAWLLAGVVAACALFYALEYGVFLIAAGVLTVATLGLLEREWRRAIRVAAASSRRGSPPGARLSCGFLRARTPSGASCERRSASCRARSATSGGFPPEAQCRSPRREACGRSLAPCCSGRASPGHCTFWSSRSPLRSCSGASSVPGSRAPTARPWPPPGSRSSRCAGPLAAPTTATS